MIPIDRIVEIFLRVPYPVDLNRLVGNVHSIVQEHANCDIYLPESMIRKIVLTSLDILENGGYDEDTTLLEVLNDEHGYHEFDRAEAAFASDQGY